MNFEHYCASNTFIFSILEPGAHSLDKEIKTFLAEGGISTTAFISDVLEKKFLYQMDTLIKNLRVKYYICYDAKGNPRYALKNNSDDKRNACIEIYDEHPLKILLKQYEESLSSNGKFKPDANTVFNTGETYRRAQDLFDTAYSLFKNNKNAALLEQKERFLSIIKDPLCLVATMLGRYDYESGKTNSSENSEPTKLLPASTLENYAFAPLPEKTIAYASDTHESTEVLPSTQNTNMALHTPEEQLTNYTNGLVKIHDSMQQGLSLMRALKEVLPPKTEITKGDFLRMCLSELDERFFFQQSFHELLYYVFCGEGMQAPQHMQAMIEVLRTEQYPALLSDCMRTVSGLLSNIMGVRIIADQASTSTNSQSPKLFVPNCSLGDLYEDPAIKKFFQSILANLNPEYTEQNKPNPVGLCVIPNVRYGDEEETTLLSVEEDDIFSSFNNTETTQELKTEDIGDSVKFSTLIEFLNDCAQRKIMSLVSLHSEKLTRLVVDDLKISGEIGGFADALKKKLRNSDTARYVSICIPDMTLLPALTCIVRGVRQSIPPMPIKGAMIVAAFLIRNDQPAQLRKMFDKDFIQNKQPGVGIGPEAQWASKIMYYTPECKALFELDNLYSAVDYDTEVLDALIHEDAKADCCYSFLTQARSRPVTLRTLNTLAINEKGLPIMLQDVRRNSYMENLCSHNPDITENEWNTLLKQDKASHKAQALRWSAKNIPLLNAVYSNK